MTNTEYSLSNANDVVIKVGNAKTGSARLVMSDWNFSGSTDAKLAHGASNQSAVAVSEGNTAHEFELTAEGEDADLWDITVEEEGLVVVQMVVKTKLKVLNFHTTFVADWEFSGSDGEDNEVNLSGVMFPPDVRNR